MSSIAGGLGGASQLYKTSSVSTTQKKEPIQQSQSQHESNPAAFSKKKDTFTAINDNNQVLKKALDKPISEKNASHVAGFIESAIANQKNPDKKLSLDKPESEKEVSVEKLSIEGKANLLKGEKTIGSVSGSIGITNEGELDLSASIKVRDGAYKRHDFAKGEADYGTGSLKGKRESESNAKAVAGSAKSLSISSDGLEAKTKVSVMGKVSHKSTCSASVCGVDIAKGEAKISAAVGAQAKIKGSFNSEGVEVSGGAFVGAKVEAGVSGSVGGVVSAGAKGGVVVGLGAKANGEIKVKDGTLSVSLGGQFALGFGLSADLTFSVKLPSWLGGGSDPIVDKKG